MKSSFLDSWTWFIDSITYCNGYTYLSNLNHEDLMDEPIEHIFMTKDYEIFQENWVQNTGKLILDLLYKEILSSNKATSLFELGELTIIYSDTMCKTLSSLDDAIECFSSGTDSIIIKIMENRHLTLWQILDSCQDNHKIPRAVKEISIRKQYLICAIGYFYDAFLSKKSNLIDEAMNFIAAAMLQVAEFNDQETEENIRSTLAKNAGQKSHKATDPLRNWLYQTVLIRHKETPFESRAAAVRNIEPDLIEEAKKYNLKPSQFNAENAQEFATRELAKRKFTPSKS